MGIAASATGLQPDVAIDALTQEVSMLKKDLATAERLAKQADTNFKAKDTQLKRSLETLARQKEQLTSLQEQEKVNFLHADRTFMYTLSFHVNPHVIYY